MVEVCFCFFLHVKRDYRKQVKLCVKAARTSGCVCISGAFPPGLPVTLALPRNVFSPPLSASVLPHCPLVALHRCGTSLDASCFFTQEDPASWAFV